MGKREHRRKVMQFRVILGCLLVLWFGASLYSGFVLAQVLPDGTQDFTGYVFEAGIGTSLDGLFTISAYGNGQRLSELNADEFGAFVSGNAEVASVYFQVEANGGLGSFELNDVFVGEYADGHFYNVTIKGYVGEIEVFSTEPYSQNRDGEITGNYPIDYSSAHGRRIGSFRVYYTKGSDTIHEDFNLFNFTIVESSSEPPVIDNTPPVVGGEGVISVKDFGGTSATLSWIAASDDITEQANLEYKVVYSTAGNISTVTDGETNGYVLADWTAGLTQYQVNNLTADTSHYHNVLVRDEAGNRSLYETIVITPFEVVLGDDNKWFRPTPGPSLPGTGEFGTFDSIAVQGSIEFSYQAVQFVPAVSGSYALEAYSPEPEQLDPMIFVYYDAFDPENPGPNFLIGNDDNSVDGNLLSRLDSEYLPLQEDRLYFLVMSVYDQEGTGTVKFSIVGPGGVEVEDPEVFYSVSFESNGGTPVDSLSVSAGTTLGFITPPSRENHRFRGWFKDSELSEAWDFEADTVDSDITLYAKWTEAFIFDQETQTIVGYFESEKDLIIPAQLYGIDVLHIGEEAFANKQLTSIEIEDGIETIGPRAFYNNVIASLTLPNSLVRIEEEAFRTNKLVNQIIPDSVEYIGDSAFHYAFDNTEATSVTLSNNLKTIGNESFENNNFAAITIPGSVESVGAHAFRGNVLATLTLEDGISTIHTGAFSHNQLSAVVIPESVEHVGDYAFYLNTVSDLQLPSGLTYLGEHAFGHNQLESVDIPVGIGQIKAGTFAYNLLSGVTIPLGIDQIGEYAFANNHLTHVTIPSAVQTIGGYAFWNNQIDTLVLEDGLQVLGEGAFRDNELVEIALPTTLESVYANALGGNPLAKVIIGADVTINDVFTYPHWYFEFYYDHYYRQSGTYVYVEPYWILSRTVAFESNQGSLVPSQSVWYGSTALKPTDPTRHGYDFIGWYADSELSAAFDFDTLILLDCILFAKWEPTSYLISYILGGGTNFADAPSNYTIETESVLLGEPLRAGYTFSGWFDAEEGGSWLDEIPVGSTGDITLYARWAANLSTGYLVEHYQQNVEDDDYTLVTTETLSGTTDEEGTAEPQTYPGFTENTAHAERVASGTIAGDGSLVLKLFYDRDEVTVTFEDYEGSELKVESVRYQGTATPPENPSRIGYTFASWDGDYVAVTEDQTVVATYTANTDTVYLVEHYQQNVDNDDGYALVTTETLSGTTNEEGTAEPQTYPGFTENTAHAERVASGTIAGDGTLILKLFYDRDEVTVTFEDYEGSELKVESVRYQGTATPPENPSRIGYTFTSWDGQYTAVTEDQTVVATYTANTDTVYLVEHYQQNVADDDYTLVTTETVSGTTDEEGTAEPQTYPGFTENTAHTERVASGTIAGDGSLVLKLFYDRDEVTVTFEDYDGRELKAESVRYQGTATPPENPSRTGYIFASWDGDYVAVTEDQTVVATYTANTDTVYLVEHYQQNVADDDYTLATTETLSGTTDEEGTAEPQLYPGFTENTTHVERVASGTIAGDGTLVLKLFYDRDEVTVTFEDYDGSVLKVESVRYQGTPTPPEIPTRIGYIFASWVGEYAAVTEDQTVVATYTANTDTVYLVEHYQQNVDDDDYTVFTTETSSGTTDEERIAEPQTYPGFTENTTHAERVASGTIAGDGSLVLKLFYDRDEVTVTFEDYDGSVLKVEGVRYQGTPTPPENPSRIGYTFASWDGEYVAVTEDQTVVATYTANTDTVYLVEHYQQNVDDDDYTVVTTETSSGTTDEERTAEPQTYPGFTENTTHAERVASGTIAGDGSLVLKLFYDRDEVTVTFKDYDGSVLKVEGVRYQGTPTPPEIPTRIGYTFAGWDGEYAAVTEDQTVVAIYAANLYTVEFTQERMDLESETIVTIHAVDSEGNPVIGEHLELGLDDSSLGSLTLSSGVTDNDGQVRVTFISTTKAGNATVTAYLVDGVNTQIGLATVTVKPGPPDIVAGGTSTVQAERTTITTAESTLITLSLQDQYGNVLIDVADVTLTANHGEFSAIANHGNGTYTATFTPSEWGVARIVGTVNGEEIGNSVDVTVLSRETRLEKMGGQESVLDIDNTTGSETLHILVDTNVQSLLGSIVVIDGSNASIKVLDANGQEKGSTDLLVSGDQGIVEAEDGTETLYEITVVVTSAPMLAVQLGVNHDEQEPGEEIIYSIRIKNAGSRQAKMVAAIAPIPEGTTYKTHSLTVNGEPVEEEGYDDRTNRVTVNLGRLLADEEVLMSFAVNVGEAYEAPFADTIVTNRARVTFRSLFEDVYQVYSSTVRTRILPEYKVQMTPGQTRTVSPGGQRVFTHIVTNDGNTVDTFELATEAEESLGIEWHYDSDGSGTLSAGDTLVPLDNGIPVLGPLSPRTSQAVLAVVDVPEGYELGEQLIRAQVRSSGDQGASASATNVLRIDSVAPFLTLHSEAKELYAGEAFDIGVEFGNQGTGELHSTGLTIELNEDVGFLDATGEGVYDSGAHTVRWSVGTLESGQTGSESVTVTVGTQLHQGKRLAANAKLTQNDGILIEEAIEVTVGNTFPSRIQVTVNPRLIEGDGESTATLTATLTDLFGNPIQDGISVHFATEQGEFVDTGTADIEKESQDGKVEATLRAPFIASKLPVRIRVVVEAENPDTGPVSETVYILSSPGALVGRLVNVDTGHSEAGVTVRLKMDDGVILEVVTDEDGYYLFDVPGVGDYEIEVVYLDNEGQPELFVMPSQVSQVGPGGLTFGPRVIQGALIDRQTNQRLPNIRVDLVGRNGSVVATTTTDEHGVYRFVLTDDDFGAMNMRSMVSALSSFDSSLWQIVAIMSAGKNITKNFPEPEKGDVLLNLNIFSEPGGVVDNILSGHPIAGATITLLYAGGPKSGQLVELPENPTNTDGEGVYHLDVVPGRYQILAEALGYHRFLSTPFEVSGNLTEPILLVPLATDDIQLRKVSERSIARPGETVLYRLELENTTSFVLNQVTIEDLLPPEVTYVADSSNPQATYDPHKLEWTLSNVGPGVTEIEYQVVIGEEAEIGSVITNHARAQMLGHDEPLAAEESINVGQWPEIDITMSTDKSHASIGDRLRYQVHIENDPGYAGTMASLETWVEVLLPEGFAYQEGTTVFNGSKFLDPEINGRRLRWDVGVLESGDEGTIRFGASVTIDAGKTDGIAQAYVEGVSEANYEYRIGPSSVRTIVHQGVFGHGGTIIGKVFVDANQNGKQDIGELGVPGLELYLDNGYRITTDEFGHYSMGSLQPGTRTLTITDWYVPGDKDINEGYVRQGHVSRFVTVYPGGLTVFDIPLAYGGRKEAARNRADLTVGVADVYLQTYPFSVSGDGSVFVDRFTDEGNHVVFRYDTRASHEEELESPLFPVSTHSGDESEVINLAPSSDPLYLSYTSPHMRLLYGDYASNWGQPTRFSSYVRRVTGFRGTYGDRLDGFLFADKWTQYIEELPGRGVSRLYYLAHGGIVPGSEQIWLKKILTSDSEIPREVERQLLTRGVDYQINYVLGSVSFSRPVPSLDESLNEIWLEIGYAIDGDTTREHGYGFRWQLDESEQLFLTVLGGLSSGRDQKVIVGLDGKAHWGGLSLSYEVASNIVDGFATYLHAKWKPSGRLQMDVTGEVVQGGFSKPGENSSLPEGYSGKAVVDYQLSEEHGVQVEKRIIHQTGKEPVHSDQIKLTYRPNDAFNVQWGFRSQGDTLNPVNEERQLSGFAQTSWNLSDRIQFSARQEVKFPVELETALLRLSYSHRVTESLSARVTYNGDTLNLMDGEGNWLLSVESTPEGGPSVYGRYAPAKDGELSATMTIGVRHRLVMGDVSLRLNGEVTNTGYAGGIRLAHDGNPEIKPSVEVEIVDRLDKKSGTIRLGLDGFIQPGLSYQLQTSWYLGDQQREDKRTLEDEVRGTVVYRNVHESKNSLMTQFLRRTYQEPATPDFGASESTVTAMAMNWGYKVGERDTMHLLLAFKDTVDRTQDDEMSTHRFTIYLSQVGLERELSPSYTLGLYGRYLVDGGGTKHSGLASELTRFVTDDVGVAIGYSSLSLDDPDLQSVVNWPKGLYLRFKLKF